MSLVDFADNVNAFYLYFIFYYSVADNWCRRTFLCNKFFIVFYIIKIISNAT